MVFMQKIGNYVYLKCVSIEKHWYKLEFDFPMFSGASELMRGAMCYKLIHTVFFLWPCSYYYVHNTQYVPKSIEIMLNVQYLIFKNLLMTASITENRIVKYIHD